MKKCPHCAGEIHDDASICSFCKSDLTVPAPPVSLIQPRTSGMAIASMVLGFLFIFLPASILAIVFGHLSYGEIKRSAGRLKGKRLAITGLIFGYFGVVLIPFLIIAALLIPNLTRAKMAANQASALGSLRRLNTAAEIYASSYDTGFPPNMDSLKPPAGSVQLSPNAANLIDSTLATGRKYGYEFTYSAGGKDAQGKITTYAIHADPVTSSTGTKHYFTDQTGVIREDSDGPANEKSKPVGM